MYRDCLQAALLTSNSDPILYTASYHYYISVERDKNCGRDTYLTILVFRVTFGGKIGVGTTRALGGPFAWGNFYFKIEFLKSWVQNLVPRNPNLRRQLSSKNIW